MFRKLLVDRNSNWFWLGLVLFVVTTAGANAQSLDPNAPTPVRNPSLLGHIAARDLGDSRLTDHYYSFTGTPGDLLITVQSRNLNGDVDVFTAGTLRPLLKLTLYAENTAPIIKSVFLRKREDLILRVEARSPNDDQGTYRLAFGGSFETIAGGPDVAEDETASKESVATTSPGAKRVSSVGARLPEPEPPVTEVASASTSATTPVATPSAPPEESPIAAPPERIEPAPKATVSPTSPRTRRPAGRRTTSSTSVKPKVVETPTGEETSKKEESGEAAEPSSPPATTPETSPTTTKPSARSTSRKGSATSRSTKPEPAAATPAPAPEPEVGPRLIIETSDGTLINRSMSTIRRVIVENGLVVVSSKDGKVDRIPLMNVVRMSIAQ
jgi:hypothetical protein